MTLALILVVFTLGLAFTNGANDVSKAIATLAGAGVSKYRTAITWGSLCTVAGALAAGFASQALVATFSGKGLVAAPALSSAFLLAVASGTVAWLIIATRSGLPVSTTHALAGSLIGTAVVASGVSGVVWRAVAMKIALPLLASPVFALVIVLLVGPLLRPLALRFGNYCLCVEQTCAAAVTTEGMVFREAVPAIAVRDTERCTSAVARIGALDALHWASSGATSFFRGMNDAPKVLAIGLAAGKLVGISGAMLYALVAAAMGAGSMIAGLRVTRTLAEKVTPITPANGLAANLVTSLLVAAASRFAVPVSTTHVSTGAIVGTGLSGGGSGVRWKTLGEILLAWMVTLPASALCAGVVFFLID